MIKELECTPECREFMLQYPWVLVDPEYKAFLACFNTEHEAQEARFSLFMGDFGYREPSAEILPVDSAVTRDYKIWPSFVKQMVQERHEQAKTLAN